MKHDLNAINAAIALGDRFVPPIGCDIRFYDTALGNTHIGHITDIYYGNTIISYTSYYSVEVTLYNGKVVNMRLNHRKYFTDTLLEILNIPEDAPPFGTWKRLR